MGSDYALTFDLEEQRFYEERSKTVDLDWLDLKSGLAVLDVGCGNGALTTRVAQFEGLAIAIGIDSSSATIGFARPRMTEKRHPILRFGLADAHALPFSSETFDATFTHTVLMHLSKPKEALREMARVTHIGGLVVAIGEGDWGTITYAPACGALDQALEAMLLNIQCYGGNPYLGKHLASLFQEAGLVDIEVSENVGSAVEIKGRDLLHIGYLDPAKSILRNAASNDFLSSIKVEAILEDIRVWCQNPESKFVLPRSIRARGRRAR